jgi:DNA-binding transcriptional MerR regulator
MNNEIRYTLRELSEATDTPARTLRYYVEQGLLPAPPRRARGTRYPEETLRRVQLIKRLRAAHFPLAEIRERLAVMSDADVADALARRGATEPLALQSGFETPTALAMVPPADAAYPLEEWRALTPPADRPTPSPIPGARSQWERILLESGVELHVQRPLSRLANKRVERILATARGLLERDQRGAEW